MKYSLTVVATDKDGGLAALSKYTNLEQLHSLIWEWEQNVLRQITKYGSKADQATTWEQVKEKWYELKNQSGVITE